MRNSITLKLEILPTGHSDDIIFMHLLLKSKQKATIFSVYSPSIQADSLGNNKFYSDLFRLLQGSPVDDKVLTVWDYKDRVGRDSETSNAVLEKHGVENCNNNGRLLLEFFAKHQLVVTNPIFQQIERVMTNTPEWCLVQNFILAIAWSVANSNLTSSRKTNKRDKTGQHQENQN